MVVSNILRIVDGSAPAYAKMLGEEWEDLTDERKLLWRSLAFKAYEKHVDNKLLGMRECVELIEEVQVADSTPKNWLRGVQEAKNALVVMLLSATDELEVRVEVPDVLPNDFALEDPYRHLRAGDMEPEKVSERERCNAQHEDDWVCTRRKHPEHFQHWDANLDMPEGEDGPEVDDGQILATWRNGQRLETLHPAFGDLDEE